MRAVLFHRYSDGRERLIANASKTLTTTQALIIVFALSKFHQFLYGRPFILIMDHKPLLALFGPAKATPAMAANRLARWALMLGQYHCTIEYLKSAQHANADALSCLPPTLATLMLLCLIMQQLSAQRNFSPGVGRGAYPTSDGAAEHLVQTFKHALSKD